MSPKDTIKRNLEKMNYDLRDHERFWKLYTGSIILLKRLKVLLPEYCKGTILDAGAGHLLYKDLLIKYCARYESMDFAQTHPDLTYITDVQNMSPIESNQYDFVFSRNVLEHVPYPNKAFHELYRVLKPGGSAIITVPYLGYLHNEPHDYWRFTRYALKKLSEDANFKIINIEEIGGLFSFAGYVFETISMGLTYSIPVVGTVMFGCNFLVQRFLLLLDGILGAEKLFPLDYLIVIKK